MAANDYSRRSKKDVLFSETANNDIEDNFDVERFIRENDSKIKIIVTIKIVIQILVVGLLVWLCCMALLKMDVITYVITTAMSCFVIFPLIDKFFSTRYTNFIENVVKSFNKIKLYSHKIEDGAAEWKKIINSPGKAYTKDFMKIEIDDKIVKAMDLEILLRIRYGSMTYFIGEYYAISLGNKTFANNMMLTKGKFEHIQKRAYYFQHKGYTIYAYKEDNINDSDMNRVYALADELRNYLKDKPFIINFSGDKILFMLATKNTDNFHYGFFNYTITDRLRRDITALKHRIQIAEILASA